MNKKNTKQLKFGIIVILALFVLYFGLNFLKGINIFSPVKSYSAQYENLGGLVTSSPVYIKGYKVGQVDNIEYDFTKEPSFTIQFSVSKDIKIPKEAKVELYDDGLMGGKALQLLIPVNVISDSYYNEEDFIESQVASGLFDELAILVPKIKDLANHADSMIISAKNILENENIKNTLASVDEITRNFSNTSKKLDYIVNSDFPVLINKADNFLGDLAYVGNNLKQIDYASTFTSLDNTIDNLNLFTNKLNNEDGTLGSLLNDKDLYLNLLRMSSNADSLIIDLKQNPKRYVHFSVFGRK